MWNYFFTTDVFDLMLKNGAVKILASSSGLGAG